jgi:hypothetical protein
VKKVIGGKFIQFQKDHDTYDECSQYGAASNKAHHAFRQVFSSQSIDQETKKR